MAIRHELLDGRVYDAVADRFEDGYEYDVDLTEETYFSASAPGVEVIWTADVEYTSREDRLDTVLVWIEEKLGMPVCIGSEA